MDEEKSSPQPAEEKGPSPSLNMVSIPREEYERLQAETREFKEKYLQALAEGENSRKRLQKERQEMIQHSIQNVVVEFLNPIDHLENALQYASHSSPEIKTWATGFEMILTQFKDVLSNHGVIPYVSEGQPFDPHLHEAIDAVPSDQHPPGTVIKENVRGYKMSSGRVVRPARVHVSIAPESTAESAEPETNL